MEWSKTATKWNMGGWYYGQRVDWKHDGNDEDGMADIELATFSVVPSKKQRANKNLAHRFFYKYVQTSIETS